MCMGNVPLLQDLSRLFRKLYDQLGILQDKADVAGRICPTSLLTLQTT